MSGAAGGYVYNSMQAQQKWGHEVKMNQTEPTKRSSTAAETQHTVRKHYEKPDVRCEHVFETLALSCGKVQGTQGTCNHNRKSS